jgi:dihydroorotase
MPVVMHREIRFSAPDDCHLHVRDGSCMVDAVRHSAKEFARAVVMPNLQPPVATVRAALDYRQRILAALPADSSFEPLMTLYLTDSTSVEEIQLAAATSHVVGCKLYPAGATTNSESGVTDLADVRSVLEAMAELQLPLLVHGEVTEPTVDIFDRERIFIERVLDPLVASLPGLRIVFEHVTTEDAVQWVSTAHAGVAATITPHHLLYDRNAIFSGGLNPHFYCLPVLKRRHHREAVLEAATSGSPKFFLGTDSAPHPRHAKERTGGCAGIFSAHAALALYAIAFEAAGAIDRLPAFASQYGADYYGLPPNAGSVTLVEDPWQVSASLPFGEHELVPLGAGTTLKWRVVKSP